MTKKKLSRMELTLKKMSVLAMSLFAAKNDFGASGNNHAAGLVPDPGPTQGNTKFLREDGTWQVPAGSRTPAYGDVSYSVNAVTNSSTSVSLAGTTPLHVVTTSVNITAVTLSANPAEGHSCHVIFANSGSSDLTVAVTHHSTNRVCPGGTDPDPLTIPAGGYVEMDFLTANGKVYVRGV